MHKGGTFRFDEQSRVEDVYDEVVIRLLKKAFPNAELVVKAKGTRIDQVGVDWLIVSPNKMVTIDVKVDRHTTGRTLFEYVSNDTVGSPGWACDPQKRNDYLGVAFVNERPPRLQVFTRSEVNRLWGRNGERWKRDAVPSKAPNPGYNTLGSCIERVDLAKAFLALREFTLGDEISSVNDF